MSEAQLEARDFADEQARWSAVRIQMLELHPFWGHLLLQLRLVLEPTLPAIAATDCLRHIWLNPLRTHALTTRQLGFVLAHEVGHQVYATLTRARGRDQRLWNCATDYAINRIVASIPNASGTGPMYEPPPGILLDRRFDGLLAEAIYDVLREEASGGDEGGSTTTVVEVAGQSVEEHGGGLDVHLPRDLDVDAREEVAERVRAAVANHRARGSRGDLPAGLSIALNGARPRIPWQRLLRRHVSTALDRDELDPRRPNRRWLHEGFMVPGLAGEHPGLVIVALDTSGSMNREQLSEACAEVRVLATQVSELRVIVADAAVQEVIELDQMDRWLARRAVRGGGGTDHRPVFEWVRKSRRPPDLFVGMTDLESAFPARAPGYPVVWICPEAHGLAPWGQIVVVR